MFFTFTSLNLHGNSVDLMNPRRQRWGILSETIPATPLIAFIPSVSLYYTSLELFSFSPDHRIFISVVEGKFLSESMRPIPLFYSSSLASEVQKSINK